MTKASNLFDYMYKIDKNNLSYDKHATPDKKYVQNTMNLYSDTFIDIDLDFTLDQWNDLEGWIFEVSQLIMTLNGKKEVINYQDKKILKECFNLIHLIYKYHSAYIIRSEFDKELKDENGIVFNINQDKEKIQKKFNKFRQYSKKKRATKKQKVFYTMLSFMLKLMLQDQYSFRAKNYANFIALNYPLFNWELIFEDANTQQKELFNEIISYFMYPKIAEGKIKHSLMILVYAFLTKRLNLITKRALDLTNRLHDLLFDIKAEGYTNTELSKNIDLIACFNYLPIFAYDNPDSKPHYNMDQKTKTIQLMKKGMALASQHKMLLDNSLFYESYENLHISYTKQELIILYKA